MSHEKEKCRGYQNSAQRAGGRNDHQNSGEHLRGPCELIEESEGRGDGGPRLIPSPEVAPFRIREAVFHSVSRAVSGEELAESGDEEDPGKVDLNRQNNERPSRRRVGARELESEKSSAQPVGEKTGRTGTPMKCGPAGRDEKIPAKNPVARSHEKRRITQSQARERAAPCREKENEAGRSQDSVAQGAGVRISMIRRGEKKTTRVRQRQNSGCQHKTRVGGSDEDEGCE